MDLIQTMTEVGGVAVATINSDDLFKALGVKGYAGNMSLWFRFRSEKLNLVDGVDFVCKQNGGRFSKKHFSLTLQAAATIANDGGYVNSAAVASYLNGLLGVTGNVPSVTRAAQFSAPAHLANVKTMSSVEIVEVINKLRGPGKAELLHKNFMAKVEGHPGIAGLNFKHTYLDSQGKAQPCYYLPKREAELMVMSESLEVQTQVYDRLAELESAAVPKLPQTYAQALMELALNVQRTEALQLENAQKAVQIEQQTMLIETQKPAVEFVERYVASDGLLGFRQVAKLLVANEREFRNFLLDRKYLYPLGQHYGHSPSNGEGKADRFRYKTSTSPEGNTYSNTYFTPKGVEWITRLWNERTPMLTRKAAPMKLTKDMLNT